MPVKSSEFDVISIHSRKGGVGKTSIGWSIAVQLAAQGHRTTLLDLDTLGTHSSQCLPLSRFTSLDDKGNYNLVLPRTSEATATRPGFGPKLPFWNWMFKSPPQATKPPILGECSDSLVISKNVWEFAEQRNVVRELKSAEKNFSILTCSPYLRDLDPINEAVIRSSFQKTYKRLLTRIAGMLREDGCRYLILDNSPGLAYGPGINLNWVLGHPVDENSNKHAWFVGNASWWEHAQIIYELTTLRDELEQLNPILVVNRGANQWGGHLPGDLFELDPQSAAEGGEMREALMKLSPRFFESPMYKSLGVNSDELMRMFLLPKKMPIAILRNDTNFRIAMQGSESEESNSPEGKPSEATPTGWPEWCEELVKHFFVESLCSSGSQEISFHRDIRDLLIGRL